MILSVSRRTDIPNYYSEWFMNRLKEGFLYVQNPRNTHQISRINLSPELIDCIVFWTKNPANMIKYLEELEDYTYYFQFTLTGYGKDIEPGIPNKREELIASFRTLSEKIGRERIIWRYDPILFNKQYTIPYHLKAFEDIAGLLSGYTEKVIISFIDLYAKTQRKLAGLGIQETTKENLLYLAGNIAQIASKYDMTVESCAEQIDLRDVGIEHGSCIDRKLIEKILGCKLTGRKDKNQRQECGCLESIEVGAYDTCPNGCKYCYANFNNKRVKDMIKLYDVHSPILCRNIHPDDTVTDRKMKSLKEGQIQFHIDAASQQITLSGEF